MVIAWFFAVKAFRKQLFYLLYNLTKSVQKLGRVVVLEGDPSRYKSTTMQNYPFRKTISEIFN